MQRHQALLLGVAKGALRTLVADVLEEMGVELADDRGPIAPDVVLVFVDRRDPAAVLGPAHELGVPIIVLVDYEDDLLIERVRRNGVDCVYPLGRPLAELRSLVAGTLGR